MYRKCGWSLAKIGLKMASGQLLFCALDYSHKLFVGFSPSSSIQTKKTTTSGNGGKKSQAGTTAAKKQKSHPLTIADISGIVMAAVEALPPRTDSTMPRTRSSHVTGQWTTEHIDARLLVAHRKIFETMQVLYTYMESKYLINIPYSCV